MTDKLKTCPWCGGEAVMRSYESHLNANSIMYSAMCSEGCCECPSGWQKSEKTATKRWNTRASDDATQQIIKAAVHAIVDVVEGDYGKYTDGDDCSHGKSDFEHCDDCIREHLIPHLQALKGLLEDDYTQQNVSVAEESSVTQTPITWEQLAKNTEIAEFMGTPLTELSEHKQKVFWEYIRGRLCDDNNYYKAVRQNGRVVIW